MRFNSFIGVDISKLYFDVVLLNNHGGFHSSKRFKNNQHGFNAFTQWLQLNRVCIKSSIACMEHTGVYCLPLCGHFEELGLSYSLQSGLQIKRSMGIQRGKNDKADARIIAKYVYLNRQDITPHKLPSRVLMKLKNLLTYRERLIRTKVSLQTAAKELKSFTDKQLHHLIVSDTEAHLVNIKKSIVLIDKKIKTLISEDEKLNDLFILITSVKGVGLQIAAHMLVSTHGFTRFKTWRKFSCYCGLAPFEYQSGSSVKRRTKVSHLGNKKIKAIIGNGIASAIQNDPEIANYYHRKVEEGKHKMIVLNAIKNKLISRVYAVVNRGTPFVPLYQHS